METIFLNAAGTVLFVRDDMEQGNWTQEEYTVNATFPFVSDKVIARGQRIAFRDPATGTLEMFEIRNVTNIEPEHYQQIIAEHIVVSELSDEHINTTEITYTTPAQALGTALTGTLWSVGTSTVADINSVDISRGSVWQAVNAIAQNWNVHITPRVTTNAAGAITGRYLDIAPAQGTWRGVRLSIEKNMSDSSVVYDDSEVLTALYGYGGNVEEAQASGDDETEELTFKDVVWTATADHPAKPANQTYLEWPEMTALYGRNGRPRFGYYQNGNITDAETLLEKTWESLKQTAAPKISISGTATDLYRLGYKDEPLRLHDTVIVEIRETGETFEKQIIKLDVDLLDQTANRPEIGDYIPNIIYINRETEEQASGGGGGGGRGQTNEEDDKSKTYSGFEKTNEMIGMVVGTKNGNNYIKVGEISIAINETTGETMAKIQADHVWMGTGQDSRPIDVVINGKLNVDELAAKIAAITTLNTLSINAYGYVIVSGLVSAASLAVNQIYGITNSGIGSFSSIKVVGNNTNATWKSKTVVTGITYGTTGNKTWKTTDGDYVYNLVTWVNHSTATINYLGTDDTPNNS